MPSISRTAFSIVVAAVALSVPASADAQADAVRQRLEVDFKRAVALFQSADTLQSEPLLDSIVAGLAGLDDVLSGHDRDLLSRALAMRAEIRFDLDRQADTVADLKWLFQLNQNFRFDSSTSPRLLQVWAQTRRDMHGRIRLPQKSSARVWIDGNRVDGVQIVSALPGSRELLIQIGNRRETNLVDVPPNREVAVSLAPTENRFTKIFVHPPRILLVRVGGAFEAYGQPFTGSSVFGLYGKIGTLNSTYTFDNPRSIDGSELGGAIRVYKHFAVGVTRLRTTGQFVSAVEASVPSPFASGSPRNLEFDVTDLRRTQEVIHIEFGVTAGRDNWEASAFAGPSLMKVSQELVSTIGVQETLGRPNITTVSAAEMGLQQVKGFNLGFDVSWIFARYVGVGGGVRYSRAVSDISFRGGTTSIVLGGTQISAGARFRF